MLIVATFAALALAACSPYDPSLPHRPFLCGDTAPRCPDGYTCITDGDRMVCSDQPAEFDAGVDAPTSPPTLSNPTFETR
ncbi:MAG TPA: hypothetical protein VGC42_25025 [Kofleriaceae bacterium]